MGSDLVLDLKVYGWSVDILTSLIGCRTFLSPDTFQSVTVTFTRNGL